MTTKIEINLSEKDLCKEWSNWIDEYGFGVKIKLHGVGSSYRPQGTWCSYLLFCDKMSIFGHKINENKYMDFMWENVDAGGGILSSLSWHSGVTLVEKTTTENGQRRILIGDDYAHYWDEGKHYTLEDILRNISTVAYECYQLLTEKGILNE